MIHQFLNTGAALLIVTVLFATGCSGQTEDQALLSLRQMTKDGKLPPEDQVNAIETRFAGKKTGALAKLLHARIKFENKDFVGAAALLNSDEFAKRTTLGDYALWMRGRALLFSNQFDASGSLFKDLIEKYPTSIRVKDARVGWATADLTNNPPRTAEILDDLLKRRDPDAYIVMAREAEGRGDKENAIRYYRAAYFSSSGKPNDPNTNLVSDPASEAESKLSKFYADDLKPRTADEAAMRGEKLYAAKRYSDAAGAYADLAANFPAAVTPQITLHRITAAANAGKTTDAQAAFNTLPSSATEREEGYRQLVLGYAKAKQWPQVRATVDEMRQKFPNGNLVAKTLIDAGLAAREAKNKTDEGYFLNTAVNSYPNSVDVAQAQFELAWFEHSNNNFTKSSQMFIDHLARYADKDTTNRGKAGYWAARDSERAGNAANACAMYNGVMYRYGANWYGYLALNRLTSLKSQGRCPANAVVSSDVSQSIAHLKTVTVAAETSTAREAERVEKSDQLSIVGLFDWAIDELNEAKKTANNSPKINLALARHYRWKGDNTAALVAMQKSYPDYAQMFPEEMGREEWDFFYPLTNWDQIKSWAAHRNLDGYQISGFIRQETVFNPRARSGANAYGLMQLLLPTARIVAKKYGASMMPNSAEDLYQPALNIELGTAFIRDLFDRYGQIEYVAVAYNAGPNRVPQWRATLPPEMDDFVEAIPFKETKQYVQGIIRNSSQYRRLYDENGNFRSNVGAKPLRAQIDSKPPDQFTAENPDVVLETRSGG
ncbi:MAG: lytic transglycosylase domain-containing protein [Acidobacteriota bacterium]